MWLPIRSFLDPSQNSLTVWGVLSSELPWSKAVAPQKRNFASKQILTDQFYCIATWWIIGEFKHHTKNVMIFQNCSFFSAFIAFLVRENVYYGRASAWTRFFWGRNRMNRSLLKTSFTTGEPYCGQTNSKRPYGDCSINNLKFSCVQFCGLFC